MNRLNLLGWGKKNKIESKHISLFTRWQFYLAIIIYWGAVNIIPWDIVYRLSITKMFVSMMMGVITSIELLPDGVRYGGLEYSITQLSFIHFTGFSVLLYSLVTLKPVPLLPNARYRDVLIGALSFLILGLSILLFLIYWPGTYNVSFEEAYHDTELKMTGIYILGWWIIIANLTYSGAFVYALIKKLRN